MNISLPESMKAWVDQQVADGGYSTASEFLRQIIRETQRRWQREQIDAKLLKALESGKPIPVDAEYWDKKRQQLDKQGKNRS